MCRYGHRISHDIDMFFEYPGYLTMLSPDMNEVTDNLFDECIQSPCHMSCKSIGKGKIDCLACTPVIDGSAENMEMPGHGSLQAMSDVEILAKKINHRGDRLPGRDLYDFVTVTKLRPDIPDSPAFRELCASNKKDLLASLQHPSLKVDYDNVLQRRRHKETCEKLPLDACTRYMAEWLHSLP